MRRCQHVALVLLLNGSVGLVPIQLADAFGLETHRTLSSAAFRASAIGPVIEQRYGIRPADQFDPGLRRAASSRLTAEEWVVAGGVDEDVPVWRVIHHFYDPAHDTGLSAAWPIAQRAPDWALEDRGEIPAQEHSYRDARASFHAGLTLPQPEQRSVELARAFYALGHVIHLIQDMAQPQHARDDAHLPLGSSKSLVETYVERNIEAFAARFGAGDSPLPTVARVRDLWAAPQWGGLAQFSNLNFVSADTNFVELREGATAENFPDGPVLHLARRNTAATTCVDGTPLPGSEDGDPPIFYENLLLDPVTVALLRNERMTTHSIFDQDLKARNLRLVFALNCFNLDTAADLLLPRAVAYSAALLRYFFRGEIGTVVDGQGLHIVNRTPGEAMRGAFDLYYDAIDGRRRRAGGWTLALAPGGTHRLPLPCPAPADKPTGTDYWLVFRGELGEEPDAVAATRVFVGCAPPPCDNGCCVMSKFQGWVLAGHSPQFCAVIGGVFGNLAPTYQCPPANPPCGQYAGP